jgi:magnesium transporter
MKLVRKRTKRAGASPGSLQHVGERKVEQAKVTILDYDQTELQELEVSSVKNCFPFRDKPSVTWMNVDGLHQIDIFETLGEHFGIHSLVLEDILHTSQRPKFEDFDQYIFVVLRMLSYENAFHDEQISLILGPNFVFSFQERVGDVFGPVRERIRAGKRRLRTMGSDYLAYALIDTIVDNYFVILEKLGDEIEQLEQVLLSSPDPEHLQRIYGLRRQTILLRKSVWPLREVISGLERSESSLVKSETRIFLRDVYDHTIQVIDAVETLRDVTAGMLDLYLSSVSYKMNEVMKVLTIIATIFIPLTFVAGIYGMNFENMPELSWEWGYFGVLLIMAVIGVLMVAYFRRKKWL